MLNLLLIFAIIKISEGGGINIKALKSIPPVIPKSKKNSFLASRE